MCLPCLSLRFRQVPSLGLQCQYIGFDYISKMIMVTIAPLFVAAFIFSVYLTNVWIATHKVDKEYQKKVAGYVVPSELKGSLTPEEIRKFTKVFASADADGSGSIDLAELTAVVKSFSPDEEEEGLAEKVAAMIKEVGTPISPARTGRITGPQRHCSSLNLPISVEAQGPPCSCVFFEGGLARRRRDRVRRILVYDVPGTAPGPQQVYFASRADFFKCHTP